jgi:Protein of unknown function (DUF1353)
MEIRPVLLALVALVVVFIPSLARAQFDGELTLLPAGCQVTGQCTLKNKLRFTDGSGVAWEAKAGLVTDGASIPGAFQPFVGAPFEEAFIRAAVIHDHYCDRHVRPWRQTHRVFYEGLIAQGLSKAKAKVMYFAVYLGGPKWIQLIPGKNCGKNCVNAIKTTAGISGFMARPADYGPEDLSTQLKKLSDELEANPDSLSLEQLDSRAQSLRPNDYYYRNGSQVNVDGPIM